MLQKRWSHDILKFPIFDTPDIQDHVINNMHYYSAHSNLIIKLLCTSTYILIFVKLIWDICNILTSNIFGLIHNTY